MVRKRTVKQQLEAVEKQIVHQPEQRDRLAAKHRDLLERVATPDEIRKRVIRPRRDPEPGPIAEQTETEAARILARVEADRERVGASVRRVAIDDLPEAA